MGQNIEHFSNILTIHPIHIEWLSYEINLFHEHRLDAHFEQYHPISMNEALLPNGILLPSSENHPEQ